MNTANVITILAFIAVLLCGALVLGLSAALKHRPAGRVRDRLNNVSRALNVQGRGGAAEDVARAERDARRRQFRHSMGRIGSAIDRIETVSGRRGLLVWLLGILFLAAVSVPIAVWVLPLPWWGKLLVAAGVPLAGAVAIYRKLNNRFSRGFLEQMPEVLDLIIRASQAGVPVPQAIRSVGDEFPAPVGPEFRRIGDSLFLGNDMTTVLDEAEARIQVPDFSFLSVCLLLQRETGGSLAETLSNLSTVIRARRDLRLKTRALTAEGRFAGGMISVIPFFILAVLWMVSPDYIAVLFDTETGHKLLMVAGGMLLVGILAIRKIANLET
ncbi:pilus assembly protein [Pusillimonas sp. TS35]|nr:pilus assembly protein [Pusillimonas sp. TS35]